jgi:hypothetical protein
MKKSFALYVALTICGLMLSPLPAHTQRPEDTVKGKFRRTEKAVANQYIVVLKDTLPSSKVANLASELASIPGGRITHVYEHALKGFAINLPKPAARALSQDPRVEYVQEDGEVSLVTTQFNPPTGLDRIDQRNLPLSGSYNYNNTGTGVNAYVIDTGILPTHQEFGGRAAIAADFVGDGQNGNDCNGHGTHVAGTIGGNTYGAAKGIRIYGVRVLNCSGFGSFSSVIAGVDWVTANHASPAVANMSLGGAAFDPLDTAVRNSITSGVTYAIAAGNSGDNASNYSPARVAEAITVGASDPTNDTVASFSNFGSILDVYAPGVNITSAWIGSDTAINTISGTSMASPHVAGVAALYLQANPTASPSSVAAAITTNATNGVLVNPGPSSPNRLLYSIFPGSGCGEGFLETKTFSATSPNIGHTTGRQEGTAWAANVLQDTDGYLGYGPYDSSFGQGHHKASFLLRIDNNTTGPQDNVAVLDVVVSNNGVFTELSHRVIQRHEFTGSDVYQWFDIEFDNPCFQLLETRVWWIRGSYMRFNGLTIERMY